MDVTLVVQEDCSGFLDPHLPLELCRVAKEDVGLVLGGIAGGDFEGNKRSGGSDGSLVQQAVVFQGGFQFF
jgi:hypothetical protein